MNTIAQTPNPDIASIVLPITTVEIIPPTPTFLDASSPAAISIISESR